MSKQHSATANLEQTDSTFRSLHERTTGSDKKKAGAGSLWANKSDVEEKKKRVRRLHLVENIDAPHRELKLEILREYFDIVDYLNPSLDSKERTVFMILWRNSRGAGRATCFMTLPEIHAQAGGMSMSGVQYVINRLKEMSLINKSGPIFGRGREQGIEYGVTLPKRLG